MRHTPKVQRREKEHRLGCKVAGRTLVIPKDVERTNITVGGDEVALTNLRKIFWPDLKLTKRDLLQYYLDVSPWLLPHLHDRAMVMKRYPNGIAGEFFFMKRAPTPRPSWIHTCAIEHHSGNVIDFPVVENVASLLWVINLGCIDLNPWYARCDDVDRPDYLLFDLDPVPGSSFSLIRETALAVRDALTELKITSYAKTTGSRGIHVYVPIVRGPAQKQVWAFAKAFSVRNGEKTSEADYRRVSRGEAPARPRAGGLQPERVESNARFGLLGQANSFGGRFDSCDLGGDRTRDRY